MTTAEHTDWIARLSEEAWPRHANPWSVITRFAAIPAAIIAIWSRQWLGWWSLLPTALVVMWLAINPFAFSPIQNPSHWISKGIFGERLWLARTGLTENKFVLRALVVVGMLGIIVVGWGLYTYDVAACVIGAVITTAAQLVRIYLFARIYDTHVANTGNGRSTS